MKWTISLFCNIGIHNIRETCLDRISPGPDTVCLCKPHKKGAILTDDIKKTVVHKRRFAWWTKEDGVENVVESVRATLRAAVKSKKRNELNSSYWKVRCNCTLWKYVLQAPNPMSFGLNCKNFSSTITSYMIDIMNKIILIRVKQLVFLWLGNEYELITIVHWKNVNVKNL